MKHPEMQLVPLHTWPLPQLDPFDSVVHAEVLVPGWQLWQALLGFSVPVA